MQRIAIQATRFAEKGRAVALRGGAEAHFEHVLQLVEGARRVVAVAEAALDAVQRELAAQISLEQSYNNNGSHVSTNLITHENGEWVPKILFPHLFPYRNTYRNTFLLRVLS